MHFSMHSSLRCLKDSFDWLREAVWQWMLINGLIFFAALVLAFLAGCNRAVFIPESSPIRMGPSVKGKVYLLLDGQWTLTDNQVQIPEGWYCVPPSFVQDESKEVPSS